MEGGKFKDTRKTRYWSPKRIIFKEKKVEMKSKLSIIQCRMWLEHVVCDRMNREGKEVVPEGGCRVYTRRGITEMLSEDTSAPHPKARGMEWGTKAREDRGHPLQ